MIFQQNELFLRHLFKIFNSTKCPVVLFATLCSNLRHFPNDDIPVSGSQNSYFFGQAMKIAPPYYYNCTRVSIYMRIVTAAAAEKQKERNATLC